MKKLILISLAAGALLFSACQQMEKVTINVNDSTAPVLGTSNVTPDAITAQYTPATFVVGGKEVKPELVRYSLAVVKLNDSPVSMAVESDDSAEGSVTADAGAVSTALVSLGCAYGETVAISLVVRARLSTSAQNGYIDSEGTIDIASFSIKKPVSRGGRYAEFDKASTWGVTGAIASAALNWDADIPMYTNGTWHVAEGVELTTSDQFKFRKDAAWAENFGAAEGISDEPYAVTLDTKQDAGAGGKNLGVSEDGVYDLLLNPDAKLYLVVKHIDDPLAAYDKPSTWGVTGAISDAGINWDTDIPMYTDGTWHVAKSVTLAATDQFKYRKDAAWADNFGAAEGITEEPFIVTLDQDQDAGAGGKNLGVPEDGVYNLFLNPDSKKYRVEKAVEIPPLDL